MALAALTRWTGSLIIVATPDENPSFGPGRIQERPVEGFVTLIGHCRAGRA